jgi:hypothetical protein
MYLEKSNKTVLIWYGENLVKVSRNGALIVLFQGNYKDKKLEEYRRDHEGRFF